MNDPLVEFSTPVARWFRDRFGEPTPPQASGWPTIAGGAHTLIISPTGSGKTLTAFLWSLDRLFRELRDTPEPAPRARGSITYQPGIRVVYVSPLKALNNDVERNLQEPLAGVRQAARDLGELLPEIRLAVRTGDTPSNERQKMLRRPPQILITTPESLYLMLTSERARQLFATTHTVIVDEIHTLVGTKRGAHLALSLERLDRLAQGPLQRIGLSATVRPMENAARFLGGQDPRADFLPRRVQIVDAAYPKSLDVQVVLPFESFQELPGDSVWSAIIPELARLIDQRRTSLIFCNNRRLAERTADRLNERRLLEKTGILDGPAVVPRFGSADLGMFAVGVDTRRLEAAGLQPIRAHHGSTSKVARLAMESALKSGQLPALVCTSSLELGIDVGEIDQVIQLQSPKSVASGLQRIGRSGHRVGQTSVGRIFPTHVDDLIEAAAVCKGMRRGEIEATETPENPLDVLAQQLVALVSVESWSVAEAFDLVRGAYPYRALSEAVFRAVLDMLSGKYPESLSRQLKALISWDRVNDRLAALPGSNVLAIGSGGTIPDRGSYSLVLADRHTKVGELDEEFVFETRPGDTFLLGSSVWRAVEITDDRVVAEPAPGEVPRMPFWRGDAPWRPYDLGRRIGAFRRELAELVGALTAEDLTAIRECEAGALSPLPSLALGSERELVSPLAAMLSPTARHLIRFLADECALDRNALIQVVDYVARQLDAAGQIATDRTIVVEVFRDAIGDPRMVVHSPFGGRVNGSWAIVLAGAIRERLGVEAQVIASDDGILLRFANAEITPPVDLVGQITSQEARARILAELPNSATFGAQFRMNAARALLLPRERAGKRTPLWLSRLRAKDLLQAVQQFDDFPIVLETFRDCLRDVLDLNGLTDVLDGISKGEIGVVVQEAERPSPIAVGLDYRFSLQYVYEYDAPRGERQLATLSVNRQLLADLLHDGALAELLKPEAVAEVAHRAARLSAHDRVRDAEELSQLLFDLGDLSDAEIQARGPHEVANWLGQLVAEGRALPWQFGRQRRWVHAEHRPAYEQLADSPGPVLRRFLAHAGPTGLKTLADRYGLAEVQIRAALMALGDEVAAGQFTPEGDEEWIDRRNLEQIHRRTLGILRREVQPVGLYPYADFLRQWQGVGDLARSAEISHQTDDDETPLAPTTRLNRVLQQLRGLAIPGVAWERDVLPARIPDFLPATLAEQCQAGDLIWTAEGGREPRRAKVRFFFRGEGSLFLERRPDEATLAGLEEPARQVYEFLASEGAALLADVVDGTDLDGEAAKNALVELVLAGLVTNDSLDALHSLLGYQPPAPVRERPRSSLEAQLAALRPERSRPLNRQQLRDTRRHIREVVAEKLARRGTWVGRWSLVHRTGVLGKPLSDDERALRQARQILARWGVVTKVSLERESASFDWTTISGVLSRLELRGEVRRGYFVEGLPGIQYARPDAVEKLRDVARARGEATTFASRPDRALESALVVLNATDPAQIFGAEAMGGPLRFPRVPSTAVAAWHGEPVALLEDDGALTIVTTDHPALIPALRALAQWGRPRRSGRLRVERWNGDPVLASDGVPPLEAAGFVRDYGGMLWVDG
ncbi:MAG TPA: DEAD/DEAH box helicase [Chloroflexota bacterium]|nr:DEAD/DEAH box helicase [Chloroflexota bacterium]